MMQKIIGGNSIIMLSAPHCVDHYRNGKIKVKEVNTDTLVKMVHKLADTSIIYKTKSEKEDANYDKISSYKEECKTHIIENNIKFFLDIHGMNYERKEDICIGTAYGRNILYQKELVDILVNTFKKYGYNNISIDSPFNALSENCVSSYISRECKIPAFQIEINNKYRFPNCKEYNLDNLAMCLAEIVKKLENSKLII